MIPTLFYNVNLRYIIFIYYFIIYKCLLRIASSVPNGSANNEGIAREALMVFKAPIWPTAFTLLN